MARSTLKELDRNGLFARGLEDGRKSGAELNPIALLSALHSSLELMLSVQYPTPYLLGKVVGLSMMVGAHSVGEVDG